MIAPRKDAARNRAKLVDAARHVFAERGLGATLDEVAERAGVGTGTAYRNFRDKHELAAEVLAESTAQIATDAADALRVDDPWLAIVTFFETTAARQAADRGLYQALAGQGRAADEVRLWPQIVGSVTALFDRAKQAGVVRDDLQPEDAVAVLAMLGALNGGPAGPDHWRRYLTLVLDGARAVDQPPLPETAGRYHSIDDVIAVTKSGRAPTPPADRAPSEGVQPVASRSVEARSARVGQNRPLTGTPSRDDGRDRAPMSVDVRTRADGPVDLVDPVAFFTYDLPAALDATAGRVGPTLDFLDLAPLTVDVDGDRWTLDASGGEVTVGTGAPDGPALRIDAEQLTDLVHDQVTPMGWLAAGRLRLGGGRLEHVLSWWLVLRAALDDRVPHVPGAVALRDPEGRPLDLTRSFAADEPAEDMRAFLAEAGFLHITGLFTADEMADVSADMDRAAPTYERGDGRSWWATLHDGSDRLVRMQRFDHESPATADLVADPRFQGLSALSGDDHRWGKRPQNRIEALFKPIGVAEGISDIPWHKDCSLGRHSYECCSLTAGISVTGADAASGQLSVVAGSHRALVWPAPTLQPGLDLPVVDLPTRTGDVTIHLSCTLHMAHPPVERERRVMYSGFSLPPPDAALAAAGRARLGQVREAAPVNVSQ